MSGDYDIPLLEFVYTLQAEVSQQSEGLHPIARTNIHIHMSRMRDASCRDDCGEVNRLTTLVRGVIESEMRLCCG
ncbi:MAG: hypothetical protein JJE37_14375 [Methyloceanibacter sp.]|nr:hypothetical protein [Methyloceanibacter sp.]